MSTKDFLEKDYYKVARRPQGRHGRRDQEGVPQARPQVPPRRQQGRRRAKAEERFKEISEAYDVLSDTKRRKEYDEARSLFGTGGSGRFRRPGTAAAGAGNGVPFDLGDLFGSSGGRRVRRRPRRRARRPVRPAAPAAATGRSRGAAPTSSPRSRCRSSEAVDGVTVPLRMTSERPVHGVPRHRRPRRHDAAHLPDLPGHRPDQPQPGRLRASPSRAATAGAAAWWSTTPARLLGQRPGHGHPHASGRASRPASTTASGSGSRARARPASAAGRPATSTSPCMSRRTRLFGRSGDNLTLTVPVTFSEAALGGEVKVPTLAGRRSR